ncbi:MAG: hypothetical protein QGF38_10555 [Rhodospirillales bacterium]|jgi:hypothetical protein|nr:hypothetical protein [Rhodospirillales bacterium]HJO97876.1 hypothetical protein [Rhodospirillales bacterium]
MNAEGHRAKAERIERSLAKCRTDDYEMIIDGAMLAVTHWINAAFHFVELTDDDSDVIHAYFETAFDRQHFGLVAGAAFLDGLEEIETLRPLHARGNVAGGEAAAKRCLEILQGIREKALALGTDAPAAD